jgi:uncharacterized protein (DUF1697 family)
MAELRALCEAQGFVGVVTYIQSGNVVFRSSKGPAAVQKALEQALAKRLGKPVGVYLRTRAELADLVKRNPFKKAAPNQLLIFFLDEAPPKDALAGVHAPGGEELKLCGRELFVHFPDGQGGSKLKLPFAGTSTGRNLNTVQKLLALADEAEAGAEPDDPLAQQRRRL